MSIAKTSTACRAFAAGCFLFCLGCQGEPPPASDGPSPTTNEVGSEQPRDAVIPALQPRELSSRPPAPDDWFHDAAAESGVEFVYRDGSYGGNYQLLESVGGGVASFDFDRDGRQDLFFPGGGSLTRRGDEIEVGGQSSGLFLNRNGQQFRNVTALAGLNDDSLYTHGCTVTDLDSDGFADVVVAGFGGVKVWRNQGDGTFRERSESWGLDNPQWNVTPAAADYQNDGLVDLYLVTYAEWKPDPTRRCMNDRKLRDICGPTLFPGQRDACFLNTGERFENVTPSAGLAEENRGLGIVVCDLDEDGDLDTAVVNDVQENQLYLNPGSLPFVEEGLLFGISYSQSGEREGSMGIDLGDFNRDGLPDLWYANYANQDNSLMRNVGGQGFVHSADVMGLAGVSRKWVGFGTCFADFDGDGWEDLVVANGHVAYERLDSPYFQPAQLFRNEQGRRFVNVTKAGGAYFEQDRAGRGVAETDVNDDGAVDLAIVHQNEPVSLLINRLPAAAWLRVELIGTRCERTAVGAKVEIAFRGEGPVSARWRIGGGSYLSHSDPRLLFPLPDDAPVSVVVTWPGGAREEFENLTANHTHVLVQGDESYQLP